MPTQLDDDLDRIMNALTAPGEMFETVPFVRDGQQVPVFRNAPPSLAHYFAHYAAEHGDREFLVDGDVRLTFAQTYAAARAVAAGLIGRHGVARGDRVGIAARNSTGWIIAYMGTLMAGGVATLLNGFWNGEELAYGIRLAGCKLVLADPQRARRMEGTDHGAKLVVFDHGQPEQGLAPVWGDADGTTLPELGPDDLATILYTSGSTGEPKGAYSDHRGVVNAVMNYAAQTVMVLHALTERGQAPSVQPCALIAVPLFHVTGEVPVLLQSFALGRKLVLMPKWDAGEALRLMEAEQVTYFVGVPLMSYELATHPDRDSYDLEQCKSFAAGGAPRPVDHVHKIRESFPQGFPLLGYGLTETNAVGCGNLNENYMEKPGSTGKASRPIVGLAIVDDDGAELPRGETGEVAFRTVANFLGYWENEAATRAAYTDDGYFRTGDLGYLDDDGYLFIVDRKKDIIIRGGENISCIEVEQAIYGNELVTECSVFGLADERYGEIPAAVYVVREGAELAPDVLRAFVAERIAPFKVPARLWRDPGPLPRLGTQKIDKRAVRAAYLEAAATG